MQIETIFEKFTLADVKVDRIMSVYAGKAHKCMCGCSGKYSYAKEHQAIASKERGYSVGDNECSDRSIKIILAKMRKLETEGAKVNVGNDYLAIDTLTRAYTVYFIPSAH